MQAGATTTATATATATTTVEVQQFCTARDLKQVFCIIK